MDASASAAWSERAKRQRGGGPKPTQAEEQAWSVEYAALSPGDKQVVGELLRAAAAGEDPVIAEPPQAAPDAAPATGAGADPDPDAERAAAIAEHCDALIRRALATGPETVPATPEELARGTFLGAMRLVRAWNEGLAALPPMVGEQGMLLRALLAETVKAREALERCEALLERQAKGQDRVIEGLIQLYRVTAARARAGDGAGPGPGPGKN